jgi:hypothetical protein
MTRCKRFQKTILLSGFAIALCTTLLGCAKPIVADPMTCRVLIDGVPALEVKLVLMRSDQGAPKPFLVGIADASGTIAMKFVEGVELPSEGTVELTALVESIGSGDWQLNAPWSDPAKSPLKVKWPAGPERVDIVLPKKAIRSI